MRGSQIPGFPPFSLLRIRAHLVRNKAAVERSRCWINPVKQFTDLTPDSPFETWGYRLCFAMSLTSLSVACRLAELKRQGTEGQMRQCLRHFTGQIHAHCELFSFP